MTDLEKLTKRINVLVKTNNRLALEFQKALAKSESERTAVEEMISRISRDVNDVTDEIAIDEEYYGVKKSREAVEKAEAKIRSQVEKEREESHKRIAELEASALERITQQEAIAIRESESLKREVEALKESRKTFQATSDVHVREVEAISNAVEEKISHLNGVFLKSRRNKNIGLVILSLLLPAVYFLGDYIDLLELLM